MTALHDPVASDLMQGVNRAAGRRRMQLRDAITLLGYDEGLHQLLATPRREVTVSIPLRRDDGTPELFVGHRVQHNFSRADAGRALFGISANGLSIKQLGRLDRRGTPANALVSTMVINIAMVVLVGNPVSILIASNIGYILAITLAVSGFLLLRKDRPSLARPIRLGNFWIAIAWLVTLFNAWILLIGATNPGLSHAGSMKDVVIGLGILSLGVILFLYRRIVQDRAPVHLRESSTDEPLVREEV